MDETGGSPKNSMEAEMRIRDEFLNIAKSRTPVEFSIEKGERAGEKIRITTNVKRSGAVEYEGVAGNKLIAVMYMNPPIGGIAQVTNAKVAQDYWRSGIGRRIYSEINADLAKVGARLEPQWGSMTPDAVRFWLDFDKDNAVLQERLKQVLAEMNADGYVEAYDSSKDEDGHWNGDFVGPDRHKSLIQAWKAKGYTQAVHDKEELTIYPFVPEAGPPKTEHEILSIIDDEAAILKLMEKYE